MAWVMCFCDESDTGIQASPTLGQRIVTVVSELASFVTGAKASALPAAQFERLRLHLTDTVVAALAGARIPEGKALRPVAGDNDVASQIGRQAAAARLTEIDDIHLASCTTPSAGIVPIALRIAAHLRQFDPDEVASAIWVGTELTVRLGLAINGPKVLYRGIWPTYFAAPLGAAAAAARMLRLGEARTAHALSLALMLVAGGVGRIHGAPSGRWFLYANAVTGGIAAALAARAGYTGDPELLDKSWLADTHGITLDRDVLTGGLGASSVYSTLSMKPFCSAKQGIAAVEAFRGLLQEGVRIDAIEKVRVCVPKAYAAMIATRAVPGARQSTMVSVAHQIALAAQAPQRLYDVDRSVPLEDAAVAKLSAKIEVFPDGALEEFYPQHWPAQVEVEGGGQAFRRRVVAAVGDPEHPLDGAAIDDKAHRVLDPLLGAVSVDEWLGLCRGALDGAAQCEQLATAFAGAAGEKTE
jgi:2-methylcitrate dehydratase PrpD